MEVLRCHSSHYLVSEFTRELHVDLTRKVGYFCSEHVGWDHSGVDFIALFTAIAGRLVLHLLPALRAAVVDHLIVVLDRLYESGDHVELGLLLDRLAIAVPGGLLQRLISLHCIYHLPNQFKIVLSLGLVSTVDVSACCH